MNLSRSSAPGNPPLDLRGSPVGALWVYRSPRNLKGRIKAELGKHQKLIQQDFPNGINEQVGFSKLIDGVIHFRLQAADPTDVIYPSRRFRAFVSGVRQIHFRVFVCRLTWLWNWLCWIKNCSRKWSRDWSNSWKACRWSSSARDVWHTLRKTLIAFTFLNN